MSVVHDKLQKSAVEEQSWYLRTSDGSVYGPVETTVLCEWAAQYRLAPGNLVSQDRKEWVDVESLADVKMDWIAERPDGSRFGPFNVLAVPVLAKSGTLSADAVLKHRRSGKVLQVEALLKSHPEGEQADVALPAGSGEPTKELFEAAHVRRAGYMPVAPEVSTSGAASRKDVDRLLRRAVETTVSVPASEPKARKASDAVNAVSAASTEQGAKDATTRRHDHATRELTRVQSDHRRLEQQHHLATKALKQEKERNDALERASSTAQETLTGRVKRLEEQLKKTTAELERARSSQTSTDMRREYEVLKREAERRERELKHEIEALREQARINGETLQETRLALEEAQRQHAALEASFHRDVDGSEERLTAAQTAASVRVRELEEIVAQKDDELRGQVETLKHAAATAEHRFTSDMETQRTRYRRLEQDAAEARAGLEARISDLEASLCSTREGLDVTKKELELARASITTTQGTAEERERCLQEEIDQICANLKQRDAELADARQKHQTLQERAERMDADLEKESKRLAADLESTVRAEEKLQKHLERQQKEYADLKHEADEATRQVSEAKTEIAGLRKQYEAALKDAERREKVQAKRLLKQEAVLKAAEAAHTRTSSEPSSEQSGTVLVRRWVLVSGAAAVVSVALVVFAFTAGRQFGYQTAVTRYVGRNDGQLAATGSSAKMRSGTNLLASHSGMTSGAPTGMDVAAHEAAVSLHADAARGDVPMAAPTSAPPVASVPLRPDGGDDELLERSVPPPWPDLRLAGTDLRKVDHEQMVVFHQGVFARGNVLTGQAVVILEDLASRLRGRMDGFVLVIEGHTDSVPVSRAAVFTDNIQLGKRRARTVKSLLVNDFGMAADALQVTSVGEKDPPYPNDSPESRLKNRTIVLRLLRRHDA